MHAILKSQLFNSEVCRNYGPKSLKTLKNSEKVNFSQSFYPMLGVFKVDTSKLMTLRLRYTFCHE